MKKWKKISAGLLSALVVIGGAAWVQSYVTDAKAEAPAEGEDPLQEEASPEGEIDTSVPVQPGARIAVVCKSTKGEFWDAVHEGMTDAVADLNEAYGFSGNDKISMTFEGSKEETDIDTQINTLDAVIAENPDVVCLCAGDMDSCLAQLEEAAENGIPVLAFDSTVADDSLISAYRGTDNTEAGRMAAEKLASGINGRGDVIVFSAQEKSASIRSRLAGFEEKLEEYPDITLTEVICQDQVEDLAAAMQEALEAYPGLAGIYCTNADTADLFLDITEKQEITPVVVGTDGTQKQLEALRDGKMLGLVSQKAWQIGYDTITAAAAMTDEAGLSAVEKEVLLEPMWIDAANCDLPETADYIYSGEKR